MTSSGARSGSTLVRQKVMPPGYPSAVIARPRLDDLYTRLLSEHDALAVFAAAGSGKTVQTQQFAIREQWPLAWLTLDSADRSASRVSSIPRGGPASHSGRDSTRFWMGASQAIVCRTRWRRCWPRPFLQVVFSSCSTSASSSPDRRRHCSAVQAFIEHLPRGVRTILLSRDEMNLSLGRLLLHGRVGRITDEDLAVTLDEAVCSHAGARTSPTFRLGWRRRVRWIAGVAFGASHHPGGHDNARDLDAYLAREVVQILPADERRFLLDSSVLDGVSLRAAQALCGANSGPLWRKVGIRHLPATTAADGTIIYHPLFRRFLREQLEIEDPARLQSLQHAARKPSWSKRSTSKKLSNCSCRWGSSIEATAAAGTRAAADFWHGVTTRRRCGGSTRSETSASVRAHCSSGPRSRHCVALDDSTRLGRSRAGCTRPVASPQSSTPTTGSSPTWRGPCCGSRGKGSSLLDRYPASPSALGVRYMLEATSGLGPAAPPRTSGAERDRPTDELGAHGARATR